MATTPFLRRVIFQFLVLTFPSMTQALLRLLILYHSVNFRTQNTSLFFLLMYCFYVRALCTLLAAESKESLTSVISPSSAYINVPGRAIDQVQF